MTQLMNQHNLTNFEFVPAVDGKTMEFTYDIYKLFKNNDFGGRKGFIGCAMSHYNLWKKLASSDENYYIIFEDDIFDFNENVSVYIKETINQMNQHDGMEIVYLGYSIFPNFDNKQEKIDGRDFSIIPLLYNQYMGGFFGYVISKQGAKKMLTYIEKNGIKHGIDYLIKVNPEINAYNVQPHIMFTEFVTPITQ